MSQLIARNEESSHWYEWTGTEFKAAYEVPKANGEMRPVTLRDARVLGLMPSVTNVLSTCRKPGLEQWKQEQYVLAALTLPRLPDEPLEAFAARAVEDAESQSAKAREFGTRIHSACESVLTGDLVEPDMAEWVAWFKQWAATEVTEVLAVEAVVGDRNIGYAGRMDLHCRLKEVGEAVVDIKTQGIKRTGKEMVAKPAFYVDWARQLAAYAKAVSPTGMAWPALINIVIDSKEPGPIFLHQWKEPQRHWEMFWHCHALWCDEREYWPQFSTENL